MTKKTIIYLLIIFSLSSWLLFSNKFFDMHDNTHAGRIAEMSLALKDGHFPVRWSQNFGFGYGMALFNFYAPLPYYFASIFYIITQNLITSMKAMIIMANIITIAGGFYLGKLIKNSKVGYLIAILYTFVPYRALNIYVRGAFSELWAMSFLPWLLVGLFLINQKRYKRGFIVLSLSCASLFLSHNITAFIFIPIFAVFSLIITYIYFENTKLKYYIYIFGAIVLGITLSAFYTIPALLEKKYTQIDTHILGEYFNYKIHFVSLRQFLNSLWMYGGSSYGPNDTISFFIGFAQIISLLFVFYIFIKIMFQKNKAKKFFQNRLIWIMTFFSLFSLFMSSYYSRSIWPLWPMLKYIQFPWRFLSIASLFLSCLGGLLYIKMNNKKAVFNILLISALLNVQFFVPKNFIDQKQYEQIYYSDPYLIQEKLSNTLPDYISNNLKGSLTVPKNIIQLNEEQQNKLGHKIKIINNKTHLKTFQTNFDSTQSLIINLSEFPGWHVYLNNQLIEHTINKGRIEIKVPKGENTIKVIFENTKPRIMGNGLSLVSILILIFYYFRNKLFLKAKRSR